jgi:hypothetical protein
LNRARIIAILLSLGAEGMRSISWRSTWLWRSRTVARATWSHRRGGRHAKEEEDIMSFSLVGPACHPNIESVFRLGSRWVISHKYRGSCVALSISKCQTQRGAKGRINVLSSSINRCNNSTHSKRLHHLGNKTRATIRV